MIYLDNAATSYPKPSVVSNAIYESIKKYGANPGRSGHQLSIKTASKIYECRKTIADFFNAKGEENVIFTLNCTCAINLVLKGILKPGDHVVTSCLEHNAVMRPLKKLSEIGINYTTAKIYPKNNDKTLNSFRKAINKDTKLIVCMHASNVWGIKLPIERIAALANEYGIATMVDAAQTAGIVPIDLNDLKIDYLCLAGHKGLYGPMGTGVLIINSPKKLNSLIEGGTGSSSASLYQPETLPDKFESGTQNVLGIIGLNAGIKFVKNRKLEKIAEHEYELINFLYNNLKNIKNVELYMGRPDKKYFVPLLSFNIKNKDSETVATILNKSGIAVRAGLHCAPLAHEFCSTLDRGAVRVCPSVFTKKSDIEMLIKDIRKIAL